jgi:VCBS repeat-containing protein
MSGKIIFLVLVLLIFSSFPVAGEVYVVFTDREFGFWAVRSYNINHTINYTSRTLNINTGDSIEWMNMDNEGDRITIVSDNLLWEGGKALGGVGSKFRFTFNSSGTYKFHTVENTRVRLNASNYSENTLTYEDDDGELHTITISREMSTEQYNYQQQTIRVTGPTIGNGTYPVKKTVQQTPSPFTATIRSEVQVTARPTSTPTESLTQVVAAAVAPKPMESYQEFTIYEILKRWYSILKNG